MTIDTKRLNKILVAVTTGASEDDLKSESDQERDSWDVLVIEVAEIKAKGYLISIANE